MNTSRCSFLIEFNKIIVPTVNGFEFISKQKILYFKAENTYAKIVTYDCEMLVLTTLLSLELALQNHFIRVHKSYLVNLDKVKVYSKQDGGYLELENGEKMPLSRHRKQKFLHHLRLI